MWVITIFRIAKSMIAYDSYCVKVISHIHVCDSVLVVWGCAALTTAILTKEMEHLDHLSPPFQWCQNGSFLLLHAFIVALGRRGLVVPFYSVQDCGSLTHKSTLDSISGSACRMESWNYRVICHPDFLPSLPLSEFEWMCVSLVHIRVSFSCHS